MGCLWMILGATRWDMKGNTMLLFLGEIGNVKAKVMKRKFIKIVWPYLKNGKLSCPDSSNASWYAGLSLR